MLLVRIKNGMYSALYSSLTYIYLVVICILSCYYKQLTVHFSWDSFQYINLHLLDYFYEIDELRLPGYVAIVDLFQFLFKAPRFLEALVVFQTMLYLISIAFFFFTLEQVIRCKAIVVFTTIVYFSSPAIFAWNKAILTESLTLSLLAIFIYIFVSFLRKPAWQKMMLIAVVLILMILIRPSSLVFLLISIGFCFFKLLIDKSNRHIYTMCSLIILIPPLLCCFYAYAFYQQHGSFTLSNLVTKQQLYVAIDRGYYKDAHDSGLIRKIEEIKESDKWAAMEFVYDLGQEQRDAFHDKVYQANMKQYIEDTIKLALALNTIKFEPRVTLVNDSYGYYGSQLAWEYYGFPSNTFLNTTIFSKYTGQLISDIFTWVNFLHVYFLCAIQFFIIIYRFFTKKTLEWIDSGIFIFILAIILTTFFGTCAEWGRTAVCVLPFTYIGYAINVDRIFYRSIINY